MAEKKFLFTFLLLLPIFAHAHTGGSSIYNLADGLLHPIHGMDHLLAMIAVGLWAAQLGGHAVLVVPISFVSIMIIGGTVGASQMQMLFVETGILTSILLLGLLISFAARVPLWTSSLIVGFFAFFHGYAHGAEMMPGSSVTLYAIGFVVTTALLHLAGLSLGLLLMRVSSASAIRIAGAMMFMGGVLMVLR